MFGDLLGPVAWRAGPITLCGKLASVLSS